MTIQGREPVTEVPEMGTKLSADDIRRLGFDWPKYALIGDYMVIEGGAVDLIKTIAKMETSRSFYRKQLNAAFAFRMQTGADYSDFTDRFDEYAGKERGLREAIGYLAKVLGATDQ